MATFVFESMTADDAANFTSSDTLIFSSATLTPADVSVLSSSNGLDLTYVTAGGKTLVFSGSELNSANGADINFTSAFIAGKTNGLFLGGSGTTTGNDDFSINSSDDGNVAYGFFGNDDITGNSGADNIFGGGGGDSIDGSSGNDHIYGFALTGTASDDGDDSLRGGSGNDYVQGNMGNDVLAGEDGNDRLNGGNQADVIFGDNYGGTVNGSNFGTESGTGNDTINGNKGDDTIFGGAGNESLRGGADNDLLSGGAGNDIILGDLGNDFIAGDTGLDIMTGGAGVDTFSFAIGDATFVTGTGPLAYFADTITDFTDGTDKLDLPGAGIGTGAIGGVSGDVLHAQAGIVLTTVAAALTYAQQLLDAHTSATGAGDVAVLEVGSDAYLFYNASAGVTIDSLVKLTGVDAALITSADIVGSV